MSSGGGAGDVQLNPCAPRTFGAVDTDPIRSDDSAAPSAAGVAPSGAAPVRAPSTAALTQLETELANLEAELAALEAGDGSDG